MHKFIVNNRIRLDPMQIQSNNGIPNKNGRTTATTENHLNAVLKLKMALPPTTKTSITDRHGRDANNNLSHPPSSSSFSSSSSSGSDPSISSCGSKGEVRTTTSSSSSEKSVTGIRMNGYLKKKRNRVGGGWRKLWFVLQNQLLVSYSSKEHYEKKLAPFKDLINLVPGTLIKPAPGARFTIETTANVVYTFRCENNKVCSDWITAICECLGIKSRRRSIPSLTSQKWSMNRTTRRVPKLPMAKNTARILQKGIIYEPIDHIAKVQQDFRLHTAAPSQSSAVTRINRMFDVDSQSTRLNSVTVSKARKKAPATAAEIVEREGSIAPASHRIPSNNSYSIGVLKGRPVIMETLTECDDIEEQMQCITLEDTSLLSTQSQEDAIDAEKERMLLSETAVSKAGTPTAVADEEPIYAVIDLKEKYQRRAILSKQTGESPSANITSDKSPPSPGYSSIQHRNLRHFSDYNNNHHDTTSNEKDSEHVIQRESSKIRSAATASALDRPKSFQLYSSAGDYEEVLHFSHLKFSEPNSSAGEDDDEMEENIYEPINIPEEELSRVHAGHKNLWRYFPKINFDAILEMGKRRHHPNNATSSSSASSVTTSSSHSSSCGTGSFSEMRKKLGTHRKSIKNRMKRMYSRSQPIAVAETLTQMRPLPAIELRSDVVPTTVNQYPSEAHNSCNTNEAINSSSPSPSPPPLPSVKLTKRDRNVFINLSRLRKSRTPVTGHEEGPYVSPDNPETNKCHSKFYDNDVVEDYGDCGQKDNK